MTAELTTIAAALAAKSRAEQGKPERVEDDAALARVARVVRSATPARATKPRVAPGLRSATSTVLAPQQEGRRRSPSLERNEHGHRTARP
jgi:hypothetical protein